MSVSWVLYRDSESSDLGPGSVMLDRPRERWLLHGGPGVYQGVVDPVDWAEWQAHDLTKLHAQDRQWVDSLWYPFSANGLRVFSQLLFRISSGDSGEAEYRAWVLFHGQWTTMYEKSRDRGSLVNRSLQTPSCRVEPIVYWKSIISSTDGPSSSIHPNSTCLYRVTNSQDLFETGLPVQFGPFDSIIVVFSGSVGEIETQWQKVLSRVDDMETIIDWWEAWMSGAMASVAIANEATLVTTGWGDDSQDLVLYVGKSDLEARLKALFAYCREIGVCLYDGGNSQHYKPVRSVSREEPFPDPRWKRLV
jgi:hypothetical protein